jgi:hypothetical protein
MQICTKISQLVNAKRIENNAKRILCNLPLHRPQYKTLNF